MQPINLLLPYGLILILIGIQFFLVEKVAAHLLPRAGKRLNQRLTQLRESDTNWYYWWAREGKDWAVVGLMASLGLGFFDHLGSNILTWISSLMAAVLVLQIIIASVLSLYLLEVKVPSYLVKSAAYFSVPAVTLASRRRTLCWGMLFLITGGIALTAWISLGSRQALMMGFISCFMGFVSVLRGWKVPSMLEVK